jgi:hypothetical protein
MAVITPDTFDPLRSYIGVRLQQGVPLVDADWNEAHDVRKFEVQAFLKWFVGNGVPEGNDGFRIAALDPAAMEDFVVRRGVGTAPDGTNNVDRGLRHVGRCLVDGMDVLIAEDLTFRDQPLHVSQGGAATALATTWGVPTIAEVPNVTGTIAVYLDVWERLVTPMEDPRLVHSGLGVESCARLKREWVVRTRAGSSVPAPGDADFMTGHSYYALATIAHRASAPITAEAIIDQRERRLLMPPATLIEDLFGPVDYRRGLGRPLVNLREAINSLLRGELPGGPEASIGPEGFIALGRGTFFDAANGLITTWRRSGQFGAPQLFAARLSLATPEAGFRNIQQITGTIGNFHHATLLGTGEVLIVYDTAAAVPDVVMKRGMLETLSPDSPVTTVTDTAAGERFPFAVAVGGEVLVFWHEDAGKTWQFKRYNVANGSFGTALPLAGGLVTPSAGERHAAVDSTNTAWVAFSTYAAGQHGSQIQVVAVPPGGLPGQPQTLAAPHDHNRNPFVMVDSRDNVWVFWYDKTSDDETSPLANGIWYRRFLRATMAWESPGGTEVPGTDAAVTAGSLAAVSDAEGGVWLFWVRSAPGAANVPGATNIWYTRRNPVTQVWGEPRQITRHPGIEDTPVVLPGPDGSFWLFWRRSVGDIVLNFSQPFYRRLFLSI